MLLQLFIFFLTLGIHGRMEEQVSSSARPLAGAQVNILLEFEQPPVAAELDDLAKSTLAALHRRVEQSGAGPGVLEYAKDGRFHISLRYPADKVGSLVALLTRPGIVTFNMVDDAAYADDYPIGVSRGGRLALPDDSHYGEPLVLYLDSIITGSDFADASQIIDEFDRPAVSFHFRAAAAKKFGDATLKSVGRRFAIVLDDHIISAPNIHSPILGGSGQITGSFTVEEAKQLASMLNSGALPARLVIVEQKVNLQQ